MKRGMLVRAILFLCVAALGPSVAGASAPWLPFGPDGGDARRMAADPHDPAHLYLGTANGWIYESHNAGAQWRRLAQVGKRDDLVLDSIVVDPQNPKHLIVGAWVIDRPDGGLFISNDGGATWTNQAEMRGQSIRSLAQSLSDPAILVAGSLQGVFRSTDGGVRWKRISPRDSTEIHEIESVAIDPADPNVIYAGTWHLPWKTTDGGDHWDNIKDGIIDDSDVFSIIVDPVAPKIVYASACSGIYKSENGGAHFEKVHGIPNDSRRTRVLLQDPNNLKIVFAGTTEGLYRSQDAGQTWSAKTGTEIIVNDVKVDPADSHRILIATDRGGVLASDDGGDTFHPSNDGFSTRQITTLKRDAMHPATLYVGVVNDKEWGGVFRSDNGGLNWVQQSEGLQGRDIFSLGQAPDGTMIAGSAHGLYLLSAAGSAWKRVEDAPGIDSPGAPVEPIHPATALTRPPVPVGRNHFAQSKSAPQPKTAAQRNALLKARRTTPAAPKTAAARRQAQLLATHRKATGKRSLGGVRLLAHTPARPPAASSIRVQAAAPVAPAPRAQKRSSFDGSVYVLATSNRVVLAATSLGLLTSVDDGETWTASGPKDSGDWRYLAAAQGNVVAASLTALQFSADSGSTWTPIALPETLTRIAALAVEPTGAIWVGGREGVFASTDGGTSWVTPKNLYVNSVSSLYYDEATNRVTLTSEGAGTYNGIVFTVQLPQRSITYADTGWTLRFARPVGDHLVAATLFDGIVVQPKVVPSSVAPAESASR